MAVPTPNPSQDSNGLTITRFYQKEDPVFADTDNRPLSDLNQRDIDLNNKITGAETVSAKTSNYTLLAGDNKATINNDGAVGQVDITLTSTVGHRFKFYILANQTLKIKAPAGHQIRFGNQISIIAGSVSSNIIGNSVELLLIKTNLWVALNGIGLWSVEV